jgi:two-component system KDP operon response regulator KdpE
MKVLVIDDEPQIRRALRIGLERNSYEVSLAATGAEGLDIAATHPLDFVILDLAMPGLDGVEVCRQLREWSSVPIIVLSVRESEQDKIAALDAGADDYLTKPFSLEELLARLRAVLRRAKSDVEPELPAFTAGPLHIDFSKRQVSVAGAAVHLTPIEYELLKFMAQHPNRVLTHRHLLTKIWGAEYADDIHTLRVHIANLRNKVEVNATRPQFLHTEPRIGYRFRVDEP